MTSLPAPRRWERVFVGAVLFLASAALLPLLRTGAETAATTDSGSSQPIWLAVYAVTAALLVVRRAQLVELLRRAPALLLLCGLAILSTAWSDAPAVTARHAAILVLTTLFAAYLASRFSPGALGDVLAWTLLAIACLSAALALLRPAYGLDHLRGDAWRGAFTTKNELGRVMALSAIVWFLRAITLRGHLIWSLFVTAASGWLVLQSQSKTALAVLALFVLVFLFLPAVKAHFSVAVSAGCLFLVVAGMGSVWLADRSDAVLASFGADPTFTGRREIWSVVWTMIEVHPWLGWGYGAFWRGLDGPSGLVWAALGATPPHAHNGLLDVWLQLGAVGVAAAVMFVISLARRAAIEARRDWSFGGLLPLLLVVFVCFYNVSESTFLMGNSLFWILLAYASVALSLRSRTAEARRPAHHGVRAERRPVVA